MQQPAEQSTSLWMATAETPAEKRLTRDERADVCVVGAGIAGLSTAYTLACAGRSVLVLDDGPIAGGQTGRTTAHLSNAIDDRYTEIEKVHGEVGARLAAESHTAAPGENSVVAAACAMVSCLATSVSGKAYMYVTFIAR